MLLFDHRLTQAKLIQYLLGRCYEDGTGQRNVPWAIFLFIVRTKEYRQNRKMMEEDASLLQLSHGDATLWGRLRLPLEDSFNPPWRAQETWKPGIFYGYSLWSCLSGHHS